MPEIPTRTNDQPQFDQRGTKIRPPRLIDGHRIHVEMQRSSGSDHQVFGLVFTAEQAQLLRNRLDNIIERHQEAVLADTRCTNCAHPHHRAMCQERELNPAGYTQPCNCGGPV